MFRKLFTAALLLAAFAVHAAVKVQYIELKPGDEKAKKAYFASKCRLWGTKGYRVSADRYNALLIMSNDKTMYAFHLNGRMKEGKPVQVNVGMIKPSHFQWYAGNFFEVRYGKKKLHSGSFKVSQIKSGPVGSAVLEYEGGIKGKVTLTLADNDDKLGFLFTPADKKMRYLLTLSAYPGTYGKKELRKRVIHTNLGKVKGSAYKLTGREFYMVFGDEYYDRALNRGDGCCAALFNPKQLLPGSRMSCGYACTAYLYMKPGTDAAVILWDFKGKSIKQALDYMKKLNIKFN